MTSRSPLSAAALLEHSGFVRAMARGVLGDDDRIDDVAQDAFVAALSRPTPPSRLGSWLASVGRRRASDLRRRDAVRARHSRALRGAATSPATDDVVAGAEVTSRLVEAVLALEEPQRTAILLRYWEGLAPREIAARLDVPVETVRTRIKRGHARLRERLDASHGGERRGWAGVLAASLGIAEDVSPEGSEPVESVSTAASRPAWGIGLAATLLIGGVVFVVAWRGGDDDAPGPVGTTSGEGVSGAGSGGVSLLAADDPPVAPGGAPAGGAGGSAPAEPVGAPAREGLVVRGTVRDEQGTPIADYPVRYALTPADATRKRIGADDAYTDAQGRYEVKGLVPGTLWLALLPERAFGEYERNVELRASQTEDFVVTGRHVLEGHVEGATGMPVSVRLDFREERAGGAWGGTAVRRRTLAPGETTFSFRALQPGTYDLHVVAEGRADHSEVLALHRDRGDLVVRLAPAQRVTFRVVTKPPLDPEDTYVWLRALPSGEEDMLQPQKDGTWLLDGRADGRYVLLVRNLTEPGAGAAERLTRLTERARDVTLPLASPVVEMELGPDEDVGLVVRTADGEPVEGVVTVAGEGVWPGSKQMFRADFVDGRVRTTSGDHHERPRRPYRLEREDGALFLRGMTRGPYRVRIVAEGYAPVEREVVVSGPATVDVTLVSDTRPVRVVSAEVGEATYWSLDGRRGDDERGWQRVLWMDGRIQISHTPTPGVFSARLEPGDWEFRLVSDAYAPATLGPIRIDPSPEPLTLRPPLLAGGTIEGTLRDSRGQGANLVLRVFRRQDDGTYRRLEEKTTDTEDGAFRIAGLAPGTYRVSLSEEGEPVLGESEVTGATEHQLELRLGR